MDELDDLIFRGYLEIWPDEQLTITAKGKAALSEAWRRRFDGDFEACKSGNVLRS